MSEPIKVKWEGPDEYGGYTGTVPAVDCCGAGHYLIYVHPRPWYCDRGRWGVHIESKTVLPLDDQEAFPRYFFKLENLKEEVELWVNAREEWRNARVP